MRISDRYKEVYEDLCTMLEKNFKESSTETEAVVRILCATVDELEARMETVGEIPQIHLEKQISPILLSAHAQLDRARLMLEGVGQADKAERVWAFEQKIYRLLNDL
ncbi:MAG: hypothetical protein C0618_01645 [Desulfuromonas sp.]|nr:MAG: hypothetical protein C0618_01645 [Desulfuromonas sp.]